MSALLFACASSTTHVVAAEGGWVTSPDGAFALFFPPGALDADLDVRIARLPEEQWEVGAPGRFTRVGDVYRVTPRRALTRDVYAVVELDSVPDVLRTPSGDHVLAVHYVWDGAEVHPAPVTRTIYFADGRVGLVGTLFELGDHFFGERVPGEGRDLVQLSARIEAPLGPVPSQSEWRWTRGALFAEPTLSVLGMDVRVASVGDGAVQPILDDGRARTWDARWDEALGLHPFELFGGRTAERTETVVGFEDPRPFTLEAAAPRDPLRDPLPGWRCDAMRSEETTLFGGVDVVSGASSGTLTAGVLVELGPAACP